MKIKPRICFTANIVFIIQNKITGISWNVNGFAILECIQVQYHRQVDFRYWFQSPRFFGSRIDSSLVKLNLVKSWTDFVFWFI